MPPLLKRLVRALHHEVSQPQGSPTVPDIAAALRLQVARIVIEGAKAGDHRRTRDATGVVASAVAYFEQNFTSPLQMDAVAEALHCSRSKLYATFKRETGMSPNDWLLRLRVKNAEELLVGSRRAVKDIALSVGFSSHAYFCQVFRKYTGRAPAKVRVA
jgi:transcriptional regulator GlxA family with amidase domain